MLASSDAIVSVCPQSPGPGDDFRFCTFARFFSSLDRLLSYEAFTVFSSAVRAERFDSESDRFYVNIVIFTVY
jgi:hypothetical protein